MIGVGAPTASRRATHRTLGFSRVFGVGRNVSSAADYWRTSLEAWAIPDEIVASAQESPWIHPPELFEVSDDIVTTPSHERARDVLRGDDEVLDVGCGGGIAAFALTPPATKTIGVDHQPAMLEMFRAGALKRGVACETVLGLWPEVAPNTDVADVVTSHHVVYNVAEIVPFVRALTDHARRRVVIEMPNRHPLAMMSDAWRHFWNLERPQGPTPSDLLDVLRAEGVRAHHENWSGSHHPVASRAQAAHFMRIRLCLPAAREGEVDEYLRDHPGPQERELSTIWWDGSAS